MPDLPPPYVAPVPLAGRLDRLEIDSALLAGNPLGDPARRPLQVYLPPGYDAQTRRYPSVYVLQGYTGALAMWDNRSAWRPTLVESFDRLVSSGESPPAIVVLVDAWTRYGGSQFVDSPGTGAYHSYLCDEVVPFVDERYRTLPAAAHRGVAGKSSGGFGAMITPMLRPDLFGGLATHAGDALYELLYPPGFVRGARALRDHYDGSYDAFWADLQARPPGRLRDVDGDLIMNYGVAACFSGRTDGGVDLPMEPDTGRLVEPVWQRWLAWDPVRMVPAYADAVNGLRAVWIDAGKADDYALDLGAEVFRRELAAVGVVDPVHFALFEGTHGGINWRYPAALAWLAERLEE